MGSFSEVVLGFSFREDTPDDVLAAVSGLEQTFPGTNYGAPPPSLPEPVREPVDGWIPDWRHAGPDRDPFEAEPWRHDWAPWLRVNMGGGSVTSAALVWTGYSWNLTCRFVFKGWAEMIHEFLEWLGPFIVMTYGTERPELIGYINDQQELRPYLLWVRESRLVMEDLNLSGEAG
jgi:hypothetical protein